MKPGQQTQSFSEILANYKPGDSGNEAARWLSHMKAQNDMERALRDMGQTRFVNLAPDPDHATISLALYAGDGVVTKITPTEYLPSDKLPLVLPAFYSRRVDCGYETGSFEIANYPYIDTRSVGREDVERMGELLARAGMEFKNGDAKADNIGRLPDGSLAVLDAGAVQIRVGQNSGQLKTQLAEWERKIHRLYPGLYAPGYTFSQTADTEFSRLPPRARNASGADGKLWGAQLGAKRNVYPDAGRFPAF